MENVVMPENGQGHVRSRKGEASPERGVPRKVLFGLVNDVRAEIQNLQASLWEVIDRGEIDDRQAR